MVIGKTGSRFREIDCSLCAENMMLAAHALGIGELLDRVNGSGL